MDRAFPHLYACLMAGGQGARLWPLSVRTRPKQFLSIFGGEPLLCQAFTRLDGLLPAERRLVVTLAELREATAQLLPEVPAANLLCEPCARNTAPAAALALGTILQRDRAAVIALLPADHRIADAPAFRAALAEAARQAAEQEAIVTLGVVPTAPSTAYGYLLCAPPPPGSTEAPACLRVERFREKPDSATARALLATGNCLWNAGCFVARASVLTEAYARYFPACLPLIEHPERAAELYPALPSSAIDYALAEHCANLLCVPLTCDWDDVGSLEALARHFPQDDHGNTLIGPAVTLDAAGCIVASQETPPRLTALLGVQDLAVIHTPRATLVCARAALPRLRELVERVCAGAR